MTDLWISTSKYEIGCGDGTEHECLKKLHLANKKDCVIVQPNSGEIYCYECKVDLVKQYEELANNEEKAVQPLVKFVEEINQKLHLIKEKTKKMTNVKLMEQVRPEKFKELSEAKKHEKKEVIIVPESIFGIENLGNTCFFNSVMQVLNSNRALVNWYLNEENLKRMNSVGEKEKSKRS